MKMEGGDENIQTGDESSDDRVLKGVTVFVEVRSNNDNRSKAICRELEQLGATIERKFTDNVTHVIYKEGTKRTCDKAKKKGVHLVSVLWVDSCKQNQEHVSEQLFPAIVPDVKTPPYFAKKKKAKCMQPKEFEEDLANMSERCHKRRARNLIVERWKMAWDASPQYSHGKVLVEDTQPRTPSYSSSEANTPVRLTVPHTPPSMKAKLEGLRMAKLQAQDQDRTADTALSNTERASDDKQAGDKTKTGTKKLMSLNEYSPMMFSEEGNTELPKNGYTLSPLFPRASKSTKTDRPAASNKMAKGQKRKAVCSGDSSDDSCEILQTPRTKVASKPPKLLKLCQPRNGTSSTPANETSITEKVISEIGKSGPCVRRSRRNSVHTTNGECDSETKLKGACLAGQSRRRSSHYIGRSTRLKRNGELRADSSVTCTTDGLDSCKEEGNFEPVTSGIDDSGVSESIVNSQPAQSQLSGSGNSSVHGLSMSVAYQDSLFPATLVGSRLVPPRPSIDDFQLNTRRRLNRSARPCKASASSNISSRELTTSAGSDENSSSTSTKVTPRKTASVFIKPKSKDRSRKLPALAQQDSSGTSSEGEKSQMSTRPHGMVTKTSRTASQKLKRSLVMTSLHTPEQEVVISVVKELGQFYMTDMVGDNTTHVVCGDGRRTLNVLYSIARGCWLLSNTWVLKSLEAGRWLDEEQYELGQHFPAAKLSRQERQTTPGPYRKSFFSSVGLIYICKKTKPPREHLVNLAQMCGGQVTVCQRKARVIVGTDFHPDVISVSPQWILDTITEFKLKAFDSYMTCRPKRQSSPEF